jgi:hypothetical protein
MTRNKRRAVYFVLMFALLLSVARLLADFLFVIGRWNAWRIIFDCVDAFAAAALLVALFSIREAE